MELSLRTRNSTNINAIYALRRSGATLQQIADRAGKSKERIRQILLTNYGSTGHRLMSTEQLRRLFGFSRHHVLELYRNGIITPVNEWIAGNGQYLLWSVSAVSQITSYQNASRRCRHCGGPVPANRRTFCSTDCYIESHKYRNMSREDKRKHLASIKKYRKKQQQAAAI